MHRTLVEIGIVRFFAISCNLHCESICENSSIEEEKNLLKIRKKYKGDISVIFGTRKEGGNQ